MKCRGIVVSSKGNPEMRTDIPVPDPADDEIQVRMASSLVSAGTERAWTLGYANAVPEYPYIPGYCCAGWVERVGKSVTKFKQGDRVACYAVNVGHREIGNVPEYRTVHLPDNVSFDHGSFASLGQTSLQGVRKCKIELGETSAFFGMGLVGMLALELAHLNGSVKTIAIDPSPSRLHIASLCGADHTINNHEDDWINIYQELTEHQGAEIVIDNTGIPSVMHDACRAAANFGRVCILGCPRGETSFDFYRLVQKKSLVIIGAHAVDSIPRYFSYPHYWTFSDDADCFLKFVASNRLILDPLIGRKVDSADAEKAYRDLLLTENHLLGMIINWAK